MEQQILKILKTDKEKGATLLLETYAGLLWSVCAKRLQNEEDIKECVNGIFAEFCLNPERYDESKGSLKNYLCEIADRRAIDMYRKNLRNQKVEEAVFAKRKVEKEELEKQQEEAEVLAEALEQLEPIDSQILRMKYYEGMTYEEIANTLGMTQESVKKRGFRGRKKLLYIILVGLIIALLAACAAAIMRKYQFSPWKGFLWSETGVYGYMGEDQYMEMDGWTLIFRDAMCVDGNLQMEIYAEGENLEVLETNLFDQTSSSSEYWNELISVYANGRKLNMNRGILFGTEKGPDINSMYIEVQYNCVGLGDGEDILDIKIERNGFEDYISLEIEILPTFEYEESKDGITLPDDSSIFVGHGYEANHNFTILSMYHKDASEYAISHLIVNTPMGVHGKKYEKLCLIDEAGREYEAIYRGMNEINQGGIRSTYNIYFSDVKAGTYTLHIPRICVQKEQVSETVRLKLPVEEPDLECKQEIYFPDGSGFCITGIRREEVPNETINIGADGNIIPNEYDTIARYYLEYEPIQVDELEYLVSQVRAEEPDVYSRVENDKSFICMRGDILREDIEIEFMNPYYMINESYDAKIEVKKLTE